MQRILAAALGECRHYVRWAACAALLSLSWHSAAFAMIGPPDAPTNVTVTEITATSARISWQLGASDGGSPLTGNTAFFYQNTTCSSRNFTGSAGVPGTSTTVVRDRALNPGVTYSTHVRSTNAFGSSTFSECVVFTMQTSVPEAPSNLGLFNTSGNLTDTNIWLQWQQNGDGGLPLTGQQINFFRDATCTLPSVSSIFGTSNTSFNLKNLQTLGYDGGDPISAQVFTRNANGSSPASNCFATTLPVNEAPTLDTVTFRKPSTGATIVRPGDTVRLDISASEPINQPTFTIAGQNVTAQAFGSVPSRSWFANYQVPAGTPDGPVGFSVTNITDVRSTAGVNVSASTDGSVLTVDGTAPTLTAVTRSSPVSETTSADSLTFAVVFSEDVTGVDVADFVATGTTATVTSINPVGAANYQVTVSGGDLATLNGTVGLQLAARVSIADIAGNNIDTGSAPATNETYTVENDTVAPTITLIERNHIFGDKTNADEISWIVEFSEQMARFDTGAFSISGTTAKITNIGILVRGERFIVVASGGDLADLNATVSLVPNLSLLTDLAGNAVASATPTGTDQRDWIIDNTDPTVTINAPAGPVSGAFDVTITFSEPVFVFEQNEITVGNGNVTGFSGSGAQYTATITPSANGNVTIDVAADVARDVGFSGAEFGNPNAAATQAVVAFDNVAPTVTISGAPPQANAAFRVTFTFSEDVTGFDESDIVVGNGSVSNVSGGGSVYTARIIPSGEGTLTVDVAAGAAKDVAGNGSLAAVQATSNIDTTAPTVTASSPETTSGTFLATFTFSEAVNSFDISRISVTNGTVVPSKRLREIGMGTNSTQVAIVADATGPVTVQALAGFATDLAGNQSLASQTTTTNADLDAPTVIITAPANHVGPATFDVTIAFNEDVTGFNADGLIVGGGATVAAFSGSGANYTATIQPPSSDATITFDVAGNTVKDAVGNGNQAAIQASTDYIADNIRPTVEIAGAPASTNGPATFNLAITFSEDVIGFSSGDITVTGGSVTQLTGAGASYTAMITTTGQGDASISIAENVATDAAGNGNFASDTVTISNVIVEETQKIIAGFLLNRMNTILQNQPDLISFATNRNNRGNASASMDGGVGRYQFASSLLKPLDSALGIGGGGERRFDIWAAIYGGWSDFNQTDSSATVAYVGSHLYLSDNLLAGALVQFDWTDESDAASGASVEGSGWMAGPYIAGTFGDSRVGFEARAAWGSSDNEIAPLGTFTDNFDTSRWLVRGKLEGVLEAGKWDIVPNASLSYFSEKQKSYTDGLGNLIPSQRVSLGEVAFGPEFTLNHELPSGSYLRPSFGVSGIWNFDVNRGVTAANTLSLGTSDFRAKLSGGLELDSKEWRIAADGYFDGVGIDNFNAYGVTVTVTKKF